MKRGLVNYRINPKMDDGSVVIRRARKNHICHGGHNGERQVHCPDPIRSGTNYVEYYGESYAYQSGARYHPQCAEQQGLVERLVPYV